MTGLSDRDRIVDAMFDVLDQHLDNVSGYFTGGPAVYDEVIAPLLAEAERRGAERAWDGCVDHLRPLLGNQYEATRGANPYREPSSADLGAQEPVDVAGEGHDAQGGAGKLQPIPGHHCLGPRHCRISAAHWPADAPWHPKESA